MEGEDGEDVQEHFPEGPQAPSAHEEARTRKFIAGSHIRGDDAFRFPQNEASLPFHKHRTRRKEKKRKNGFTATHLSKRYQAALIHSPSTLSRRPSRGITRLLGVCCFGRSSVSARYRVLGGRRGLRRGVSKGRTQDAQKEGEGHHLAPPVLIPLPNNVSGYLAVFVVAITKKRGRRASGMATGSGKRDAERISGATRRRWRRTQRLLTPPPTPPTPAFLPRKLGDRARAPQRGRRCDTTSPFSSKRQHNAPPLRACSGGGFGARRHVRLGAVHGQRVLSMRRECTLPPTCRFRTHSVPVSFTAKKIPRHGQRSALPPSFGCGKLGSCGGEQLFADACSAGTSARDWAARPAPTAGGSSVTATRAKRRGVGALALVRARMHRGGRGDVGGEAAVEAGGMRCPYAKSGVVGGVEVEDADADGASGRISEYEVGFAFGREGGARMGVEQLVRTRRLSLPLHRHSSLLLLSLSVLHPCSLSYLPRPPHPPHHLRLPSRGGAGGTHRCGCGGSANWKEGRGVGTVEDESAWGGDGMSSSWSAYAVSPTLSSEPHSSLPPSRSPSPFSPRAPCHMDMDVDVCAGVDDVYADSEVDVDGPAPAPISIPLFTFREGGRESPAAAEGARIGGRDAAAALWRIKALGAGMGCAGGSMKSDGQGGESDGGVDAAAALWRMKASGAGMGCAPEGA
ncbi:hypothetical protein B0H11DRAFT_2427332 [Mycena galericulata]|nr:hypothetical protein B0H11DRAFT_2427332 [Mycena galericulata]